MAMSLRSKLVVIAAVAVAGVAAQPTILGSMVDRCTPTTTGVVTMHRAAWVMNAAESPGIDWINLEVEADLPGDDPDDPTGLPGWLGVPVLPTSAPERRVGSAAMGWPVRWMFCQWVATDTEHFFPPFTENEEPCQSLRRSVRDWGRSADGARVERWVSVPRMLLAWLTIGAPMALVVLVNRQSAGKSGKAA